MQDLSASLLAILLTTALVVRVTRLITADSMPALAAMRRYVWKRVPFFGDMFHESEKTQKVYGCDWCVSVWVGFVVVPLGYFFGTEPWFVIAGGIAGASYAAGILAAMEPGE